MNSTIKHVVKVCETDPSIIEVYAGGHWPHLSLTQAQATSLWTQLGELLAQPKAEQVVGNEVVCPACEGVRYTTLVSGPTKCWRCGGRGMVRLREGVTEGGA